MRGNKPSGGRLHRTILTLVLTLVLPLALALPAVAQPRWRDLPEQAQANRQAPPDHARGKGNGPFPPNQARQRVRDLPAPAQRVFCNVPDNRIGVQLWTVRSLMGGDVEGTLAAIADIGYQNVEPFSFHGLTAQQFADLLDEYGLNAPSMHTNVNALQNDVDQLIEDLQTIGAEYATLAFVGNEWRTPEGVEELAQILNEAGAQLAEAGIQLTYHNHDFEFETMVNDDQTMFEYLVENTDPDNVEFQLDIYWAAEAGLDPAEIVEQYGDRISLLHVKDMDTEGAFENVGEGTIDFCEIFQQQRFAYYFVENDAPGDDPIAAIRTSYQNLRNQDFQQAD